MNEINEAHFMVAKMDPQYVPHYIATITAGGTLATFWCPACRKPHWHSPEPGHVVAHCHTGAHKRGYVIHVIREAPAAPRKPNAGSVYPKYPATV